MTYIELVCGRSSGSAPRSLVHEVLDRYLRHTLVGMRNEHIACALRPILSRVYPGTVLLPFDRVRELGVDMELNLRETDHGQDSVR